MYRRRLLKLAAAAGVAGSVYASLRANDWDMHAIGLVRFGRAAITVSSGLRTMHTFWMGAQTL